MARRLSSSLRQGRTRRPLLCAAFARIRGEEGGGGGGSGTGRTRASDAAAFASCCLCSDSRARARARPVGRDGLFVLLTPPSIPPLLPFPRSPPPFHPNPPFYPPAPSPHLFPRPHLRLFTPSPTLDALANPHPTQPAALDVHQSRPQVGLVKQFIHKPELHARALVWFLASGAADMTITAALVFTLARLRLRPFSISVFLACDVWVAAVALLRSTHRVFPTNRKTGFGATDTVIDKMIRSASLPPSPSPSPSSLLPDDPDRARDLDIRDIGRYLFYGLPAFGYQLHRRPPQDLPLSKLYSNALLSTLNAREELSSISTRRSGSGSRDRHSQSHLHGGRHSIGLGEARVPAHRWAGTDMRMTQLVFEDMGALGLGVGVETKFEEAEMEIEYEGEGGYDHEGVRVREVEKTKTGGGGLEIVEMARSSSTTRSTGTTDSNGSALPRHLRVLCASRPIDRPSPPELCAPHGQQPVSRCVASLSPICSLSATILPQRHPLQPRLLLLVVPIRRYPARLASSDSHHIAIPYRYIRPLVLAYTPLARFLPYSCPVLRLFYARTEQTRIHTSYVRYLPVTPHTDVLHTLYPAPPHHLRLPSLTSLLQKSGLLVVGSPSYRIPEDDENDRTNESTRRKWRPRYPPGVIASRAQPHPLVPLPSYTSHMLLAGAPQPLFTHMQNAPHRLGSPIHPVPLRDNAASPVDQ
ncbi:hypothetical protein C8R45DRAFT_1173925 [Mycena sanguinolenta]|nr:hypothetical protein C8R45DRAFT_1173925 [Mycena sanguinolenta]